MKIPRHELLALTVGLALGTVACAVLLITRHSRLALILLFVGIALLVYANVSQRRRYVRWRRGR